jgi:AhpD family alkylhydroperoxidase
MDLSAEPFPGVRFGKEVLKMSIDAASRPDAPLATLTPRLRLGSLAPESYRAMSALVQTVRDFDPVIAELVKIRASQINGCAYCIDMHTKDARFAGETEQRIYALNAWRETPFFAPRERAALALCEEMTKLATSNVPDDVYEEAAQRFEPNELAQLIWTITIINAWNRIAVTSRMVPGSYQPKAVE